MTSSRTGYRERISRSADDPQVPARVLGIFAARDLLPDRYVSERVAQEVHIDIGIRLAGGGSLDPKHLARVLCRIRAVQALRLSADGRSLSYELEATP